MMRLADLQRALLERGISVGAGGADGAWGKDTRAAVMQALTEGPDTRLTSADIAASAQRLGVSAAAVKAVDAVESSGAGFLEGRPSILFEPHRFSRATGRRFDASHPAVSYRAWDKTRYPRAQAARYAQLLEAVGLDVDAGFASASYGRFQILGENFRACGFDSPFAFAMAMAFDEAAQLRAFEAFLDATGLVRHLRLLDFDAFADGYNGTASKVNHYGAKLRAAWATAVGARA